MSELQIFKSEEFGQIRTLENKNGIWFVAKDVCEALNLSNPSITVNRLDSDEVTKLNLGGQVGETNLVNEYGLYNLVLGSRKSEAKEFKRWITHKVIPSIRKTGQYSQKPKSIEDLIIMQAQSVKELRGEVKRQQEQIQNIKGAIIHTDEDWRRWVNSQLNRISFEEGNYQEVRKQSYDILENRASCRLSIRLDNLKDRMIKAGATKTAANKACMLDVIETDVRLKEIYTAIVEKLVIKFSA